MNKLSHCIDKLQDLDELQRWMCQAIRTPSSQQGSITPEPVYYLTDGRQMPARDRLNIYVDDYWSRCINSLAEDFPGLEHIWGHQKFHSFVEQYLVENPSRSYTLRNLGNRLLDFVVANYGDQDKELVCDMIRFEWAKIEAFDNPVLPAFDALKLSAAQQKNLASLAFSFQPHLTLLELGYPVYEVVDGLLKNPDKKNEVHTPPPKDTYSVVYRYGSTVFHKEIEKPYFRLLEQMKKGLSLSTACDKILPQLDSKATARLEKKVKTWFQDCVGNGWLAIPC